VKAWPNASNLPRRVAQIGQRGDLRPNEIIRSMTSTPYCPPAHRGLAILYLSARVIVVNKPSGLLSVPGRGAGKEDCLSRRVQVEGFVVREAADIPSNWRSDRSLHAFLKDRRIVGIQGIDTRALTRALRVRGVMMGAISTEETADQIISRIRSAPAYASIDLNKVVTTEKPYSWPHWKRGKLPLWRRLSAGTACMAKNGWADLAKR